MQNRWAATITAGVRPESDSTSVIEWSIDMLGNKHYSVLGEILVAMTVPVDDLGLKSAVEKLGKLGRFFGFREIAVLLHHLRLDERALEIGQGQYLGKTGIVVVTTRRLMFIDRGFMTADTHIEEFNLSAITSLGLQRKRTGETLDISISGRSAQISNLQHGRGDALVHAFHSASSATTRPAPAAAAAPPDLVDHIRRLAELRDQGILTQAEFETKKADLLSRM